MEFKRVDIAYDISLFYHFCTTASSEMHEKCVKQNNQSNERGYPGPCYFPQKDY